MESPLFPWKSQLTYLMLTAYVLLVFWVSVCSNYGNRNVRLEYFSITMWLRITISIVQISSGTCNSKNWTAMKLFKTFLWIFHLNWLINFVFSHFLSSLPHPEKVWRCVYTHIYTHTPCTTDYRSWKPYFLTLLSTLLNSSDQQLYSGTRHPEFLKWYKIFPVSQLEENRGTC